MIQPDAIVRQVWHGMVPADWQVIHGKRASAFAAGCFATFFSLILLIVLGGVAVVLISFAHLGSVAQSEHLSPDFFNPTTKIWDQKAGD